MRFSCFAVTLMLTWCTLVQSCAAAKKTKIDQNVRKHEIFLAQLIKTAEGVASALEMVKDPSSAKRAARRIDQNLDKMLQLKNREATLPAISREDHQRLYKMYSPKLDSALNRMKKAAHQAGRNSGGEKSFVRTLNRMIKVGAELQRGAGYVPETGNGVNAPKGPNRKTSTKKRKRLKINRFGR